MNPAAGFWRRYAAYSLDIAIVTIVASPLLVPRIAAGGALLDAGIARMQQRMGEIFAAALDAGDAINDPFALAMRSAEDPQLQQAMLALAGELAVAAFACVGILVAVAAAWFIAFEASPRQATPGKRALGLQVAGVDGGRPPAWRIVLRFVAGAPSWLFLHIGHAMAGWNKDKRALHDLIAGTRVLLADGAEATMPRYGRAWLILQACVFAALCAWVAFDYARLILLAGLGG